MTFCLTRQKCGSTYKCRLPFLESSLVLLPCQLTTYKQAYCWLRGRTTTFSSFCLCNFYLNTMWCNECTALVVLQWPLLLSSFENIYCILVLKIENKKKIQIEYPPILSCNICQKIVFLRKWEVAQIADCLHSFQMNHGTRNRLNKQV